MISVSDPVKKNWRELLDFTDVSPEVRSIFLLISSIHSCKLSESGRLEGRFLGLKLPCITA